MLNYYYKESIGKFLLSSKEEIIGAITLANQFDSTQNQNKSWEIQIPILKGALNGLSGDIFFEFSIPRMGKRIDVLLIIDNVILVVEFKVGGSQYLSNDYIQVWDYALDLVNFHEPSHNATIVPILVATEAEYSFHEIQFTPHNDNLVLPLKLNASDLQLRLNDIVRFSSRTVEVNGDQFAAGSYKPTPTIIEAAISLYNNHTVEEITRSDAAAQNLTLTSAAVSSLIEEARNRNKKIICFVTGVPGAGKTLVGLKVATQQLDISNNSTSVYLSGNGPLVAVLQEALARDKVKQESEKGNRITKSEAKNGVKAFIQIIHHYRDAYLSDPNAPFDHVAIFDEAQRAWNKEQTVKFMRMKKGEKDFDYSEPEFLISCLDRHKDWAVVVCLVGGGQEINTGEAGISAWLYAIAHLFRNWEVHISPNLTDSEYNTEDALRKLEHVKSNPDLHLKVSMRSFRAEKLSLFIKQLLDIQIQSARETLAQISEKYPIVLTRDLGKAKSWVKTMARGSERYGLVASSQAYRLKPQAIDVKTPTNPIHWFLNGKDDVRSSYFLEDVATEFQIQGLELDWICVVWDGDLRYHTDGWKTFSFVGTKWQNINKEERQRYLLNAYRVLLTRARQGFVIVIPEGDTNELRGVFASLTVPLLQS
jgi:DUF2075 family protein